MDRLKRVDAIRYLLHYIVRENHVKERGNSKLRNLLSNEYKTWCIKNNLGIKRPKELLNNIFNNSAKIKQQ